MSSLNSLYTIGSDYKDKSFKYVNGFWIATLGIFALAQKFPNSAIIHNYLTKPYPLSDDAMLNNGHTMTDPIAAVKALYDNKTMMLTTWLKFTAFFRECKSNNYKKIDDKKFKKIIKEMIFVHIRPHQLIQPAVFGFLNGKKSMEDTIYDLYKFNEQYKLSPNFRRFCLLHKRDLIEDK